MVTRERKLEIVSELKDLKGQITELINDALQLVQEAVGKRADLDKRTWHAHIEQAVSNDHQWLGRSIHTLQDAIEEIEEDHDEDEEIEEELDDDVTLLEVHAVA